MPTKQEYEDTFNEVLGTSIKWHKLSKEDLSSLATVLSNPEFIAEKLGIEVSREPTKNILRKSFVDGLITNMAERAGSHDGPLVRAAKKAIEKNL